MVEDNSNLKDNPPAKNEVFTESQIIQMEKDIEELDKVSLLEKEVKQLRDELTDLHLEVKFLKKTLAFKFPVMSKVGCLECRIQIKNNKAGEVKSTLLCKRLKFPFAKIIT